MFSSVICIEYKEDTIQAKC